MQEVDTNGHYHQKYDDRFTPCVKSQVEFAQKILISNGFMAQLELGQRKLNERLIRLIKTTFGVNEAWLRTGGAYAGRG
jgi:hypothetical protein